MDKQETLDTVDSPAFEAKPRSRSLIQTDYRSWSTAPLWMQAFTIIAAVVLVVWLIDELF